MVLLPAETASASIPAHASCGRRCCSGRLLGRAFGRSRSTGNLPVPPRSQFGCATVTVGLFAFVVVGADFRVGPFVMRKFILLVRPYEETDLAELKRIHSAQNFPYAFPDLQNPLFLTKIVLTDGENVAPGFSPALIHDAALKPACAGRSGATKDNVLGAVLLRLTAEAYLLLDPGSGTPRERWQSLLALHEAARRDAWQRGLEDVHAWLPPAIANKFGRRLTKLGWLRDDSWTPYCKRLGARET